MQPDSRYQSWLCADVHKVFREREGETEKESSGETWPRKKRRRRRGADGNACFDLCGP